MSDVWGLSLPHLNRTPAELHADSQATLSDRHIELIDRRPLELIGNFQPLNMMLSSLRARPR